MEKGIWHAVCDWSETGGLYIDQIYQKLNYS